MIYKFNIEGVFPVKAQTAGEEMARIYDKRGVLDPADIVEESRDAAAPLHPCFEWDDAKAAEKYREQQAEKLIRAIVIVEETPKGPQTIRAFPHVEQHYHPIQVVLSSEKRTEELLHTALRELISFEKKYEALSALNGVFAAIDQLTISEARPERTAKQRPASKTRQTPQVNC